MTESLNIFTPKFIASLNRLSQDMHELHETLRVKTSIVEGETAPSRQFIDSLPKANSTEKTATLDTQT